MAERGQRASPLGAMTDRLRAASSEGATLRECPFLAQINIRGAREDGVFLKGVETAIGVSLPLEANRVAVAGEVRALWLGPDEWLIVTAEDRREEINSRLAAALADGHVSVVDVSASRTTLELGGEAARAVLEKGCTLDLHPRAFGPGQCAGTVIAKMQIILEQVDDTPVYRLYVRSSFAEHMAHWLMDAMAEFGTDVAGS